MIAANREEPQRLARGDVWQRAMTRRSTSPPRGTCGTSSLPPSLLLGVVLMSIGSLGATTPLELRAAAEASETRVRGKLILEIRQRFTVDAFIGNATDWERVCLGNLVGMPVIVVPTGFKSIENPPKGGTRRRTTITTGIYAPPEHDHIVLALAMAYQSATDQHKKRPPIDDLS